MNTRVLMTFNKIVPFHFSYLRNVVTCQIDCSKILFASPRPPGRPRSAGGPLAPAVGDPEPRRASPTREREFQDNTTLISLLFFGDEMKSVSVM